MKIGVPRKHKSPAQRAGEMTLVEHLQELRKRLILAVLFILVGTIIGFIWYRWAPGPIMSLGDIVKGPYCRLPAEYRADFTEAGECRLLATGPMEMFMLRLKVGALAGLIISSPLWLYQVWAFIVPGLHKSERRWTISFVSAAVMLFVSGALLAYGILHFGLLFLTQMGEGTQIAAWTGQSYYNLILGLVIVFGIAFEIPLFVVVLNILGILEYRVIKGKRRLAWVGVYIFGAVLTPGGDPYSMLLMGTSVGILVELSFQFCRWNDKRRGYYPPRDEEELDDEQASKLAYTPEPVVKPTPVAPAGSRVRVSEDMPSAPDGSTPIHTTDASYFDDVL